MTWDREGSGGGSSPLTTKGDIYTHDGTADARKAVGTDGHIPIADAAQTVGWKWGPVADAVTLDPSTITGLAVWLDADAEAFADGDSVGTWTDQSGNSNDATQATGANQPTFRTHAIGGRSALRFDGSNDRIVVSDTADLASAEKTVFLVGYTFDRSAQQSWLRDRALGGFGTASGFSVEWQTSQWSVNTFHEDTSGNAVGLSSPLGVLPRNQEPFTMAMRYKSSEVRCYMQSADMFIGNTVQNGATPLGTVDGGDLYIGSTPPTAARFVDGLIAEVLIYDNDLSAADFTSVMGYLADKYSMV